MAGVMRVCDLIGVAAAAGRGAAHGGGGGLEWCCGKPACPAGLERLCWRSHSHCGRRPCGFERRSCWPCTRPVADGTRGQLEYGVLGDLRDRFVRVHSPAVYPAARARAERPRLRSVTGRGDAWPHLLAAAAVELGGLPEAGRPATAADMTGGLPAALPAFEAGRRGPRPPSVGTSPASCDSVRKPPLGMYLRQMRLGLCGTYTCYEKWGF